jgi:ribosomal protein S18 acetylase RimI-like enzyme
VTPDEVELRPVSAEDWELWRDLRLRVLATDPDAFGSTLDREQALTETEWRRRLVVGGSFVACVDGRPVGMGGCIPDEPGAWSIVSMWVDPAARGLGIGRRVLEHLLATLPEDAEVRLWVVDDNPARGLYESLGFVTTGERAPLRPGATLLKSRMRLAR